MTEGISIVAWDQRSRYGIIGKGHKGTFWREEMFYLNCGDRSFGIFVRIKREGKTKSGFIHEVFLLFNNKNHFTNLSIEHTTLAN